jgi:hypothetical protein
MKDILEEARAEEERKREQAERPIREAAQKLNENHRKLFDLEKAEVIAGRPDPSWELPASAAGLSMSVDEAKAFVQREAEAYRDEHPEYYPSPKNFDAIKGYLSVQHVAIPNKECFALAVERLTRFGLLEERPTPAQSLEIEEQHAPNLPTEAPSSDLVDGWDIESGEPRKYSEKEIWQMSSSDLKKAFRMWAEKDGIDRRPKFNRSRYQ